MKGFIFGFLLGGVTGAGITALICKSHLEKERETIRKEYKEYYERKQEEEDEAKMTHVKVIPDKPVPDKEEKQQYTELVREYDRADFERPTEEDLIEEAENTEKMHNALEQIHGDRVKLIQVESFGEIQSYDCESLTYYVYDKTLTHEDGSIVDDVNFLIGDALDRYGWADDDENEDALYVRNYKLAKDFEIVKVMEEYPEK